MKTYMVRAERCDGWWALEVPEVPGLFSQARRLDHAEGTARDALATMLDLDPESFQLEVVPMLDDETSAVLDDVLQARDGLARARRHAAGATQQAIQVLIRRDGLTMRDARRVLGVSSQSVAQLSWGQQLLAEQDELAEEFGEFGAGRFSA
jgi:predicted RNase H-like HicB family nuclease